MKNKEKLKSKDEPRERFKGRTIFEAKTARITKYRPRRDKRQHLHICIIIKYGQTYRNNIDIRNVFKSDESKNESNHYLKTLLRRDKLRIIR